MEQGQQSIREIAPDDPFILGDLEHDDTPPVDAEDLPVGLEFDTNPSLPHLLQRDVVSGNPTLKRSFLCDKAAQQVEIVWRARYAILMTLVIGVGVGLKFQGCGTGTMEVGPPSPQMKPQSPEPHKNNGVRPRFDAHPTETQIG